MRNEKGFEIVELMVITAILMIISFLGVGSFVNNRGATEKRAFSGSIKFLQRNDIKPKRISCSGDSNNDGYGTCNVLTVEGEKIILNCPTNYFDVVWFGASECKEVFQNFNMVIGQKNLDNK